MRKGLLLQTSAAILTAAMVFSVYLPVLPARAEENPDGFCVHHSAHTEECGYSQATPENSCTYQVNGCPYCVTDWQWEDSLGLLTKGTNGWELNMPGVSTDNPLAKTDLEGFLPAQIQATADNGDSLSLGLVWDLSELPDSLTAGTYTLTAALAETEENYALTEEAAPLTVTLQLGGAQTLANGQNGTEENPGANVPFEEHTIKMEQDELYTPGTVINLFDYWLTGRLDSDDTNPANLTDVGINKDHFLTFRKDGGGTGSWNAWTGNGNPPRFGLVQATLDENGYPVFDQTSSDPDAHESLDYLFDPTNAENSNDKKVFPDVGGLLQIDEDGYYYYSSQKNFAWFNESSGNFVLYNTWGIKNGGSSPQGQFFPFNYPQDLFTVSNNQFQAVNNINSRNPIINHYFGLTMTTRFVQKNEGTIYGQKPVTYNFSGDDDVWIFIDDVLVADLGGIHDMASVEINFQTGDITIYKDSQTSGTKNKYDANIDTEWKGTNLKSQFETALGPNLDEKDWRGNTFADDTYHTLKFFYLERGNTDSNMSLKYNLIPIPESDITKVDQLGNTLSGVEFELYPADRSVSPDKYGDYVYTIQSGSENTPIWEGSTGANGEISILDDETHSPLTFKELSDQYDTDYFILREVAAPDGYRKIGDACLHYIPDTGLILADNYWATGAYAQPKITTTATTRIYAAKEDGTIGTDITNQLPTDPDKLTMFAVVFKRLDMNESVSDENNWAPVSGNAQTGWKVWDDTNIPIMDRIRSAAEENAKDNQQNKFELTTGGSLQVTIENLPGDITKYYWYLAQENSDLSKAEYTVNYYYLPEGKTEPVRLFTDHFDREFSTHMYIPNVKNYLLVQKVDEYGTPINGVGFSLYNAADVTVDPTTGQYTINNNAQAYDTLTTGTVKLSDKRNLEGGGVFPTGSNVLKSGTYYLIETNPPAGYLTNDQVVKVIVDDTGVYADAGTSGDGVTVLRGVGSVLKSMLQFAADDPVDTTLHDIQAVLQTGTVDGSNALTWTPAAEDSWNDALHLSYEKGDENAALEYGPREAGGRLALAVDEGWGRLSVRQCYQHDNSVDTSLKTNLQDRDITSLFSGTCTVRMTNYKDGYGSLSISKTVTGGGDTQREFSFTVTLTDAKGTPLNGSFPYTGSKSGTITSGGQITLKHNESVTITGLPATTRYTVTETPVSGYTTTSTGDTGVILAGKTAQAAFTNDMPATPPPSNTPGPQNTPSPSDNPDSSEPTTPSDTTSATPAPVPASGLPQTSDPSLTWLWALLCVACVGGLFLLFRGVLTKREKHPHE